MASTLSRVVQIHSRTPGLDTTGLMSGNPPMGVQNLHLKALTRPRPGPSLIKNKGTSHSSDLSF